MDIHTGNVGFTGSRKGMTAEQRIVLRALLHDFSTQGCEFHHGDCVGADSQAHDIAWESGHEIVIHPPSNPSKRAFRDSERILPPFPYLSRNHMIVDECDYMIATPSESVEVQRSGTWATIRYTIKVGKPVYIIYPSGIIERR